MRRLMLAVATTLLLATSVAWAQAPAPAPADQAAPTGTAAPAAPEKLTVDKGDTAWLLTSAALVLMMTAPGLALF